MSTIRARYEQIWPSGWQENVEIEIGVAEGEQIKTQDVIALLEEAAEAMPHEGDPTQEQTQGVLFSAEQLAELQQGNGQPKEDHAAETESLDRQREGDEVRS